MQGLWSMGSSALPSITSMCKVCTVAFGVGTVGRRQGLMRNSELCIAEHVQGVQNRRRWMVTTIIHHGCNPLESMTDT